MPTLKSDPQGGYSIPETIRFERLDSMGSRSANLIFVFSDGNHLSMHLPRKDLVSIHEAIGGWLEKEPAEKDELQSKH